MNKNILIFLGLLVSLKSAAVELYTDFPTVINPSEAYVFYSHGLIVEGTNSRPISSDYGIYEFAELKQALFKDSQFNLIAHHRPANTAIDSYVDKLESWVQRLLDGGVKPSKITLLGFSRGGHLTAFTAARFNQIGINTVLLASCIEGDIPFGSPVTLGGNLLSIWETSDVMGACSGLKERSANLVSFTEISISTGLTHGAFFQPLADWLVPLKQWLIENNH